MFRGNHKEEILYSYIIDKIQTRLIHRHIPDIGCRVYMTESRVSEEVDADENGCSGKFKLRTFDTFRQAARYFITVAKSRDVKYIFKHKE